MDIDLLSKMVKELILDSDKVVLPGLGAFVAEIVPSTFSDKGYTINPPYRRLYFRSKPDDGDELAVFYAKSNSIDVELACKIIGDFVNELKTVLYSKKLIVFPGLGRLRATKENNVFFVADENLDIYPAGFGLEPVSLKTHSEPAPVFQPELLKEVRVEVETEAVMEQEAVAELQPETLSEPQHEPLVEPESQPEAQPEAQPEVQPESQPEPDTQLETLLQPEPQPAEKKSIGVLGKIFKTILWIVLAAVVALALFALVARVAPDLVDKILYTQDELKILYY